VAVALHPAALLAFGHVAAIAGVIAGGLVGRVLFANEKARRLTFF